MLLALDTSTRFASIALYNEFGVQGEHTWHVEQNHTEDLMPHVVALMAAAHVVPATLTGVVVALGPGSFNGLRVAMSAAKGMAIALHIPIVGFSTLETLAYQHGSLSLPVRPILEGGGPELATALYRVTRNHWAQVEEPRLATVDSICEATTQRTLFCGEISPALAAEFRQRLENAVIAPPAGQCPPRRLPGPSWAGIAFATATAMTQARCNPCICAARTSPSPRKKSTHPRE